MFGSTVLDLGIGLIFAFLLISLITSTATEAVASAAGWRADTLLQGVKDLLNDQAFTGLAKTLYNHGLVNPQSDGKATDEASLKAKPSYIDAQHFAAALTDVLKISPDVAKEHLQDEINKIPDPQLKGVLSGIVTRADGNIDRIRSGIAAWFNQSMDRVAGVYKRYAQLWNFLIALILAIAFNLDAVKIVHALWDQPMLVKDVAPPDTGWTATQALDQMKNLQLPFGWDDKAIKDLSQPPTSVSGIVTWVSAILGWLIMAGSTLFGASFWFDALQRITQLRGAGSK
jgi:hypothetical protein